VQFDYFDPWFSVKALAINASWAKVDVVKTNPLA
jgi:hypothetical protein